LWASTSVGRFIRSMTFAMCRSCRAGDAEQRLLVKPVFDALNKGVDGLRLIPEGLYSDTTLKSIVLSFALCGVVVVVMW
jgi:hypothetical protein